MNGHATGENLSGHALKIYAYLLESSKPVGVREMARALSLPASTVHYHLKRLEELGLATRNADGYLVNKIITLEGFLLVGRKLVPRLLVYSFFFLGLTIGEIVMVISGGLNPDRLITLASCITAFSILLLEGLNARRKLGR